MRAKIDIDGTEHELVVSDAIAFTAGEFTGNVDVELEGVPAGQEDAVGGELGLQVAGAAGPLTPHGWGREPGGAKLGVTFQVPELGSGALPVPATVELFFGERKLGTVPCARSKDQPVAIQEWVLAAEHEGTLEEVQVSTEGKNLRVRLVAAGAFAGGDRSNVLYVKLRVPAPRPDDWREAVAKDLKVRAHDQARVIGSGPWGEDGLIVTFGGVPHADGPVELAWRDRPLGSLAAVTFVSGAGSGASSPGCAGALVLALALWRMFLA